MSAAYNWCSTLLESRNQTLKASLKIVNKRLEPGKKKIKWMEETEMAVVISQEQNETKTSKKWDLDIKTHRTKMQKRTG